MQTAELVRRAQANPEIAQEAQEALQQLLSRSATDPEFRSRLLTDTRATVAEFTGRPVPESWNVNFIESGGTPTIVLPDPVDPAAELSADELESVAGGATPSILTVIGSLLAIYDAAIDDR